VPAHASPAGTVGLSWAGVPNASEYRIYQSSNAFSNQFTLIRTLTQTLGTLNTSATITGLTPGTTYFFRVSAFVNGVEQPVPSSVTTSGVAIGGAPPPQVQVGGQTSNSVTLTWLPVPGVSQYRVAVALGNSTAFQGAVLTGLTLGGATVTGLAPSTSYTFRITPVDSFGQEGPPAFVTATTTA
jgi:hypothetical protein